MTQRGVAVTAKTPLIKLNKIEDEPKSSIEETKLTSSAPTKKEGASGATTIADTYKQRLTAWRRNMSKGMIFADQLDIRNPQMVTELA